jgi:DNA-binding response OmpR family regulator
MAKLPVVLIVDDDPDIRSAVRITLRNSGYDLIEAASAEAGMVEAIARKPALILLDVMMPTGTEGFHFVWDLRAHTDPEVAGIPIILLTALHQTSDLRFDLEVPSPGYNAHDYLPVQGFMEKPIDPEKLLTAVRNVTTTQAG